MGEVSPSGKLVEGYFMLTTCKSVTNVSQIFLLHSHTLAVNLHVVCKWRELPSMVSDSVWSVVLCQTRPHID